MDWLEKKVLSDSVLLASFPKTREADKPSDDGQLVSSILQYLSQILKNGKSPSATNKGAKSNGKALEFYQMGEFSIAKGTVRRYCRKLEKELCRCCRTMFEFKEFEDGIEFVTKGIAHSVAGSTMMFRGYKYRAESLCKLSFFEECLTDLDNISRQFSLIKKKDQMEILMIQAKCYAELAEKSLKKSKLLLRSVPINDTALSSMKKKLKKYRSKASYNKLEESVVLEEIENPNRNFPCASDAIEVKYSPELGRHIVASRDIDIGELLVVEEPYSATVNVKNIFIYCWHCLKSTWTGIPCDSCVSVIYCSERCKANDVKTHLDWECPVMGSFMSYGKDYGVLQCQIVGLRLLFEGAREAGTLQTLMENVTRMQSEKTTDWFFKEALDQSTVCSLENILAFAPPNDESDSSSKMERALDVVRIVFLLATCTEFFGTKFDRTKIRDSQILAILANDSGVHFVAKMLMKLPINPAITCLPIAEYNLIAFQMRGFAMYPFCNLFNHSCYCNTFTPYKGKRSTIYSSFPIKKGEEVNITYRPFPPLEVNSEFKCKCESCEKNWPALEVEDRSYKDRAKSEAWKIKIDQLMPKFLEIQEKIDKRDIRNVDETRKQLYNIIKLVSEGIDLPCSTLSEMLSTYLQFFFLTGNFAKNFKQHAHMVVERNASDNSDSE